MKQKHKEIFFVVFFFLFILLSKKTSNVILCAYQTSFDARINLEPSSKNFKSYGNIYYLIKPPDRKNKNNLIANFTNEPLFHLKNSILNNFVYFFYLISHTTVENDYDISLFFFLQTHYK